MPTLDSTMISTGKNQSRAMPSFDCPRLVFPEDFTIQDGLYLSKDSPPAFDYSDGNAIEAKIHSVVRAATDRSSGSFELERGIHDWPTEYHLSRARTNLLRPFDLGRFENVLEIGSGCGAITRYLGETCRHVTALEGSVQRASIVRDRCSDLNNVTCLCANVSDVRFSKKFDLVIVIGVWEYSGKYLHASVDPWQHFLHLVLDALAPGGVCLLAIENQLGLKYLAGAFEDHTGRPYEGIEGYYPGTQIRTFGRHELVNRFAAAGMATELFLPFPDYKLPRTIIRANATLKGMGLSQWHDRCQPVGSFCEPLVTLESERNGLLPDLANSFLVVASRHGNPLPTFNWDATYYALGRRRCFQTETRLVDDGSKPVIIKSSLYPKFPHPATSPVSQHMQSTPFHPGHKLSLLMLRSLRSSDSLSFGEFNKLMAQWNDYLAQHVEEKSGLQAILPRDFVDATPFNLIQTQHGLELIDREWSILDQPVTLGWVLFRGLFWFLKSYSQSISSHVRSRGLWCSFLLQQFLNLNYSPSTSDLQCWIKWEARFQSNILENQGIEDVQRQILQAIGPFNSFLRISRRAAYRAADLARRLNHALRGND